MKAKTGRLGRFLLVVFLFTAPLCLIGSAQCGHGGYDPPPNDGDANPAPNPVIPGTPGTGTPATAAGTGSSLGADITKGGLRQPTGPSTPSPRATGKGGMTKKARGKSSNLVTWEVWWARNRYQFFEVADIFDNTGEKFQGFPFPTTPGPDKELTRREQAGLLLKGLRQDSVTAIKPYLSHNAPLLRRISLFALGRLRDASAAEAMIEQLQDNNHYVRDAAILGLGINGSPEARHMVLHVALGTDQACQALDQTPVPAYVRAIAISTLALTEAPGLTPVLQSIAGDQKSPEDVRAMAIEGLGLLGGEYAASYLISMVEDPKLEPRLGSHALSALSKTGERLGLPTMHRCLFTKQIPLRQAAAMGLWRLALAEDEEAVKKLYLAFKNTNDQAVKGFALVSMGIIGGGEAMEKLNRLVAHGASSERAWACLGLGFALRGKENAAAVRNLILQLNRSGNQSTRSAACIALGLCKSQEAVPHLIKILQGGESPTLRGYAAMGLGMTGSVLALGPLRKSLKEDRLPQVLGQTVLALGIIHDLDSAPALMDCMIDTPNIVTKGMISRSLQYMGEKKIAEEILDRLVSETHDVRTTKECICLLSRLLSAQTAPFLDRLSANTNFVCEYPVMGHMLEYGL